MLNISEIAKKVEQMFDLFNKHFYYGELTRPAITVSPDGGRGAYGWCSIHEIWNADNELYREINLCAEHLARPFEQVAETLLHEMVHLYNLQIGVQDTSRGGTYHNKKYKEAAEQHGLTVEKDAKYGWTKTSLNDEAKAFVDSMQDKKFELHRKSLPKIPGAAKTKQSSRKYSLPRVRVHYQGNKGSSCYMR